MFIQWNVWNKAVSKIIIIFGSARIVHLKLTVADVSDLGADDVFAPGATARAAFSTVPTVVSLT